MTAFPRLKSGAVMQFPAQRTAQYATQVFRFLDGTEQRYREYRSAVRRWIVRLELLDEDEVSALQEFFTTVAGRSGSFEFQDPWDGTVHDDCSLENDELSIEFTGVTRAKAVLVVRKNGA